jgi:hypothetical protein
VYVGVPPASAALEALGIPAGPARAVLGTVMAGTDGPWTNPRPLGPAIVRDAWRYARRRLRDLSLPSPEAGGGDARAPIPPDGGPGDAPAGALAEALVLFVLPQYSGLDGASWTRLCDRLAEALAQGCAWGERPVLADSMRCRLDAAWRGLAGELP